MLFSKVVLLLTYPKETSLALLVVVRLLHSQVTTTDFRVCTLGVSVVPLGFPSNTNSRAAHIYNIYIYIYIYI